MDKVKCVIIDDELFARKLLADYIKRMPNLELSGAFSSPVELISFLNTEKVDLIFLDIQMPDITGIDFLKNWNIEPAVIFTTAYPDYALEGYQLDVSDYLLKPFSFARFMKGVSKAIEHIELKRLKVEYDVSGAEKTPSEESVQDYIIVRSDRKIHRIYYEDLLFVEGAMEYVNFITTERKIMGLFSLKELTDTLPDSFMRVHKSYLVHLKKIDSIDGNQVIIGSHTIPVARNHKAELLKKLNM